MISSEDKTRGKCSRLREPGLVATGVWLHHLADFFTAYAVLMQAEQFITNYLILSTVRKF